jgi:hypothetical protein
MSSISLGKEKKKMSKEKRAQRRQEIREGIFGAEREALIPIRMPAQDESAEKRLSWEETFVPPPATEHKPHPSFCGRGAYSLDFLRE